MNLPEIDRDPRTFAQVDTLILNDAINRAISAAGNKTIGTMELYGINAAINALKESVATVQELITTLDCEMRARLMQNANLESMLVNGFAEVCTLPLTPETRVRTPLGLVDIITFFIFLIHYPSFHPSLSPKVWYIVLAENEDDMTTPKIKSALRVCLPRGIQEPVLGFGKLLSALFILGEQ